ncbi:ABC transporter ATP-binding protein [Mucisphaera sp.]|uniref:ABC transporter ATP-binding protein n=1 Tax=Mucisphaera sp. TaxID=2913024 RepID=UPI003D09DF0B
MLKSPFWKTAHDLLRFRRAIVTSLVATVIAGVCFGAGLSMIVPVFGLFFSGERSAQTGANPLAERIEAVSQTTWLPTPIQDALLQLSQSVPDDPLYAFAAVMAVIFFLTIIANVMRYIQQLLIATVAERQAATYRDQLYARLIQAQTEQFLSKGAADHVSKIWFDVRVVVSAHVAVFGKGIAELVRGLSTFTFALILDPVLTGAALIASPAAAVVIQKMGKRIRRRSKDALHHYGAAVGKLNESMSGLQTIKIYNAEGFERRRFRVVNRNLFRELLGIRKVRALASPLVELVSMIGVIAAAMLAAWYIIQRGANPEVSVGVLTLLAASAISLKPVTQLNNVIRQADPAAQRILDALVLQPEPSSYQHSRHLPALPRHHQSIVFQNVNYRYPNTDTDVLKNINLTVPARSTTAIVGGNGAGKSTLVSLIPRLISPAQGHVLIDGIDIASVSLRSLRKQIAYVPQKTLLFQGTIADNIAYARGDIPRDAIVAAAKAALADEFIQSLPQGYDTSLGETGSGLSGGQAQRIAIARAILRNPTILILDEATSQIDTESEARITQAIENFASDRTTFVIAHRMSTVVNADQIAVMDQGQLIDLGTHYELLQRCHIYQNLTQTQLKPTDS